MDWRGWMMTHVGLWICGWAPRDPFSNSGMTHGRGRIIRKGTKETKEVVLSLVWMWLPEALINNLAGKGSLYSNVCLLVSGIHVFIDCFSFERSHTTPNMGDGVTEAHICASATHGVRRRYLLRDARSCCHLFTKGRITHENYTTTSSKLVLNLNLTRGGGLGLYSHTTCHLSYAKAWECRGLQNLVVLSLSLYLYIYIFIRTIFDMW